MNRYFVSEDGTFFIQLDSVQAVVPTQVDSMTSYTVHSNGMELQISYTHALELNNALLDYEKAASEFGIDLHIQNQHIDMGQWDQGQMTMFNPDENNG